MAIQFTCTACSQPIEVDDAWANQAVTCPYCRAVVTTPATTTLGADAPPSAGTVQAGGEEALPYAAPPPPRAGTLGWVALGCTVISMISLAYLSIALVSMLGDIDVDSTDPEQVEQVQKIVQERMQSRPGLQIITMGGACAVPLAGIICAVVALVRKSRPRWPAIAALVLLGGVVVVVCLSLLVQLLRASGQAG